jgi:hypothetical protein
MVLNNSISNNQHLHISIKTSAKTHTSLVLLPLSVSLLGLPNFTLSFGFYDFLLEALALALFFKIFPLK